MIALQHFSEHRPRLLPLKPGSAARATGTALAPGPATAGTPGPAMTPVWASGICLRAEIPVKENPDYFL